MYSKSDNTALPNGSVGRINGYQAILSQEDQDKNIVEIEKEIAAIKAEKAAELTALESEGTARAEILRKLRELKEQIITNELVVHSLKAQLVENTTDNGFADMDIDDLLTTDFTQPHRESALRAAERKKVAVGQRGLERQLEQRKRQIAEIQKRIDGYAAEIANLKKQIKAGEDLKKTKGQSKAEMEAHLVKVQADVDAQPAVIDVQKNKHTTEKKKLQQLATQHANDIVAAKNVKEQAIRDANKKRDESVSGAREKAKAELTGTRKVPVKETYYENVRVKVGHKWIGSRWRPERVSVYETRSIPHERIVGTRDEAVPPSPAQLDRRTAELQQNARDTAKREREAAISACESRKSSIEETYKRNKLTQETTIETSRRDVQAAQDKLAEFQKDAANCKADIKAMTDAISTIEGEITAKQHAQEAAEKQLESFKAVLKKRSENLNTLEAKFAAGELEGDDIDDQNDNLLPEANSDDSSQDELRQRLSQIQTELVYTQARLLQVKAKVREIISPHNGQSDSPIITAILSARVEVFEEILKLNQRAASDVDQYGWTPLHTLCAYSDPAQLGLNSTLTQQLLRAGANPQHQLPNGKLPHMLANSTALQQQFLNDVLANAAHNGDSKLVDWALKHGADAAATVNFASAKNTILTLALLSTDLQPAMIQSLLQWGADTSTRVNDMSIDEVMWARCWEKPNAVAKWVVGRDVNLFAGVEMKENDFLHRIVQKNYAGAAKILAELPDRAAQVAVLRLNPTQRERLHEACRELDSESAIKSTVFQSKY